MSECKHCKKKLSATEIALTRKLVNRMANEFLCLTCLASHFSVSEELLLKKAEEFKKSGCLLFQ
ncbi:MAG: hypothetical protein IJ506_03890 [Clostridia bacterium]|nr:hypothetical protein [Clostridia bacterium]